MNSIGFKHFRRFANFPEIPLGDVTILVGGNNSGKSTVVKALLLCVDNLRLMRRDDRSVREILQSLDSPKNKNNYPQFSFDATEYNDVKINEFGRAIHNRPVENDDIVSAVTNFKKKILPTSIEFTFTLNHFKFTILISGDRDEHSTTGNVDRLIIEDCEQHVRYTNDYVRNNMSYEVLNADFEEQESVIQKLATEMEDARRALKNAENEGDLESITSITTSLDKIRMQIKSMLNNDSEEDNISDHKLLKLLAKNFIRHNNPVKVSYDELPLQYNLNDASNVPLVLTVIDNIKKFHVPAYFYDIDDPEEYQLRAEYVSRMEEYHKAISLDKDVFDKSRKNLETLLRTLSVEYISAHAANQNAFYSTTEKNDYIALVVHNFWKRKIHPGDSEYEFVREWMQKFDIGIDFNVDTLVSGVAYTVSITESDGNVVSLADKGMGSIQIMILLLRLATILNKLRRNESTPIVVIEEPEQNLHPKMQSLLADLFYYLANAKNCKFLIETHSEYLIRKSQVIVSEEDFVDNDDLQENNKFKVYYLPSDGTLPYEMQYTISGRFANKFGEGFFDEAGKANLITLRKEKGLK